MNINFSFDSSVSSAPSGFISVLNQVASFYSSVLLDSVTVTIAVGWGEVAGHALGSGAVGQTTLTLANYSYAQITQALGADAKSSLDATAVASLPTTDPTGGSYSTTLAQAKALGLSNSTTTDASIGFAATSFDFDNTNGVSGIDFFGVAAHEIGHALGWGTAQVGIANRYTPEDLFHYSSPHNRIYVGGTGYLSGDDGVTKLADFNKSTTGDRGAWDSNFGPDAFLAFVPNNTVLPVSATDIKALDLLGWDVAASSTPPPPDTVLPTLSSTSPADNATGVAVGANLVLNFSEAVKAGTGNVVIHTVSDGKTVASVATNDTGKVSISASTVTINPANDLAPGTHYYVTIDSGAIQDLAGNAFAGISTSTGFDFTTAAPMAYNPFLPFIPTIGGFSNPFTPSTPSDPGTPSTPTTPGTGSYNPLGPYLPTGFNPFSPFTGPSFTAQDGFNFSAVGAQDVTSDSYAGYDLVDLPPTLAAIGDAGSDPIAHSVVDGLAAAHPTHIGAVHPIATHLGWDLF